MGTFVRSPLGRLNCGGHVDPSVDDTAEGSIGRFVPLSGDARLRWAGGIVPKS